jgi:hypothetical protein
MRSADECLAKANELSRLAEHSHLPEVTAQFLLLADAWIDLAARAEWHDSGKYADAIRAYRARRS